MRFIVQSWNRLTSLDFPKKLSIMKSCRNWVAYQKKMRTLLCS